MKKITRISVALFCILLFLATPVLGLQEEAAANPPYYDSYTDGIFSAYYPIDAEQGFLYGIAPGTTIEQLQKVCLPGELSVSQEKLTTGTVLTAQIPAEAPEQTPAVHTLTAVVTGDLNGDGNVTITDMLMLKSRVLGHTLESTAEKAGDINYDGNVSITDFLRIKSALLGKETIVAGRNPATQPEDTLLLMTPGSMANWTPAAKAASFESGNEALVAVAGDGTVIAGDSEGTAFIYALDSNGRVAERAVVTILQEKLSVSLDAAEYSLLAGQTQKPTVRFNHPVTPVVTWTTTDSSIASVDETGVVTAHSTGTVQLTASLENGSCAQALVTVIPPITALEMGRDLYKVKPGHSRTLELLPTPSDVEEVFTWATSDPKIVTVDENGTVTGVAYGTATVTATGKYSGLSVSCQVKVCDVKQIAITFDDGPSAYTTELLDYLKENDFKVTFFLVGNRLSTYPDTLKRQVDEGHEIGYHSFAHAQQTSLSSEQITSDFERSEAILRQITGAEFTLWRTPGGGYNNRVLQAVDVPHIMWSVDTLDWKHRDTYQVYSNIMRDVRDGSIVLLHDLYKTSVEGAKLAMDELWAGDYEFLTVTELLSRDGTPPVPCKSYFNG